MYASTARTMSRSLPAALIAGWIAVAAAPACANVITDWDEKATAVLSPMPAYRAERVTGMVHVAMFDAVNSIDRRYRPYLVQLPAAATSTEAAAAAAAAAVVATIDPKTAGEMKVEVATYLASVPESPRPYRKRMASSSARQLRQGSWRRGRTTAPMRPRPTGRERCPAFDLRKSWNAGSNRRS
jgi:hypothetical protein